MINCQLFINNKLFDFDDVGNRDKIVCDRNDELV